MGRSRSRIQRAKSYRWELPEPESAIADGDSRQRWEDARAKSIAWAVEAARDPRVVYLDTETTGFGPRAEIVDIGSYSGAYLAARVAEVDNDLGSAIETDYSIEIGSCGGFCCGHDGEFVKPNV